MEKAAERFFSNKSNITTARSETATTKGYNLIVGNCNTNQQSIQKHTLTPTYTDKHTHTQTTQKHTSLIKSPNNARKMDQLLLQGEGWCGTHPRLLAVQPQPRRVQAPVEQPWVHAAEHVED